MARPGDRLRRIAARGCDPTTMERLIDPVLADLQTEYVAARRLGRVWRSRWIRCAGYAAFLKVLAWHAGGRCGRALVDWPDEDRRAIRRTIGWSIATIVPVTLLLEVPFVSQQASHGLEPVWFVFLIPQALALALPIGFAVGLACGPVSPAWLSRRCQWLVRIAIVACTVLSFANLAWVVPAANQAFRSSVYHAVGAGQPLGRGVEELTLGEIFQLLHPGTHEPMLLVPPPNMQTLTFQYHLRLAFSASTCLLAWLALSLKGRRWIRMIAIGIAIIGWYMVLYGGRRLVFEEVLPASVVAWLPNAALGVIAGFNTVRVRLKPDATSICSS